MKSHPDKWHTEDVRLAHRVSMKAGADLRDAGDHEENAHYSGPDHVHRIQPAREPKVVPLRVKPPPANLPVSTEKAR